jgi:radical SAM superfamily enzyme YgiQ (UPF0313 family)
MEKLKVYLCDPTHETIIIVSDTIPINIGYIGAYLEKNFGDKVEISLFKYPDEIIERIKSDPPDLLGLSNYSWNSHLSEHIATIAKKKNPDIITLQGGTNFPHARDLQFEYLLRRPSTDIHAVFEAEISTSDLVERILECDLDKKKIFEKPLNGCVFIHPEKKELIIGEEPVRVKALDDIPSPYLNGMMDKFFDGRLTPFVQTNRGCPFKCTFCHTGADYYNKVFRFSPERLKGEIEYMAKKSIEKGLSNLHFADVNFAMYAQDKIFCEMLLETRKKYNWPLRVMSATGKNNKMRAIEITSILGEMFPVSMSAQSMDDNVLKNINRSNIKLDDMIEINKHLNGTGRETKAELIIGLPGETKKSFIEGINNLLNSNTSSITIYTLMMLYGTEFKDPGYRKRFQYKGKFRIVPFNFGEYDGKKIIDYEEVGVENKDLSFEDYLFCRVLALFVETLYNGKPFYEFFKYANIFGIKPATLMGNLYENITNSSGKIQNLVNEFVAETKSELWDSEEELLECYEKDENYLKLKNGEVGGNLIYKYKSKNLIELVPDWINYLEKQIFIFIKQNNQFDEKRLQTIKEELSEIASFCSLKLDSLFNPNSKMDPVEATFKHNILNWLDSDKEDARLKEFKLKTVEETLIFEYTEDQKDIMTDMFKRYGKSINGISRIVTRLANLQNQYRKVRFTTENMQRSIYKKNRENFTKYSLSG